ncbi:unnamed protein product, partial [Tilletia laevis]
MGEPQLPALSATAPRSGLNGVGLDAKSGRSVLVRFPGAMSSKPRSSSLTSSRPSSIPDSSASMHGRTTISAIAPLILSEPPLATLWRDSRRALRRLVRRSVWSFASFFSFMAAAPTSRFCRQ